MQVEIERKFLVCGDGWQGKSSGVPFRQGYLQKSPCTVRVRTEGTRGVLTIKSPEQGISRLEYEYEIPLADANAILDTLLAKHTLIYKTRYRVFHAGKTWIVDVFSRENAGLILAEIELQSETERFDLPPWIGKEVTHDPRYKNSNLAEHPFSSWGTDHSD